MVDRQAAKTERDSARLLAVRRKRETRERREARQERGTLNSIPFLCDDAAAPGGVRRPLVPLLSKMLMSSSSSPLVRMAAGISE